MPNKQRSKYIGVFDSGFGGLDILRGITKELPDYDFIYLGDTARIPYGTRSKAIVYRFTKQAVRFLFSNDCELIIFACNTASSDSLRRIQQKYLPVNCPEKRVLGVIIPAVELAAKTTKNKRVGVIATQGTVSSGSFVREMAKIDASIDIFQNACPLLVPIVEAGEQESEITPMLLKKYLAPLMVHNVDTLILGCTHYGILKKQIQKVVGRHVQVISEAEIVAERLKDYLERHPEIEKKLCKNGKRIFYSTDLTENFSALGSQFYGQNITVQKVNLENN